MVILTFLREKRYFNQKLTLLGMPMRGAPRQGKGAPHLERGAPQGPMRPLPPLPCNLAPALQATHSPTVCDSSQFHFAILLMVMFIPYTIM